MSRDAKALTAQAPIVRGKQIKSAIRKLKNKIKKIESEGEVAPENCHIIRYQIRRNQKIYWYYKLQAKEPIFPMLDNPEKKTKYIYLGKAGSEAHIDAVEKMTRRNLIDELERMVISLQESYLDLCFGGETEADLSYSI
ncbi:MAG: hypothetical protein ACFBSE_17605 [Prochloraceae cyanobacterium]